MRRVLVLGAGAPVPEGDVGARRLAQIAALYRAGGFELDGCLSGLSGASAGDMSAIDRMFTRLAIVAPGERPRGIAGFAGFAPPEAWDAVHLLGDRASEPVDALPGAAALVRDFGGVAVPPVAVADALVVAFSDHLLGDVLRSGAAVRLPYRPPAGSKPRLSVRSEAIGWVGPGGHSLASGWSALLDRLCARQGGWPGGIRLSGVWASDVVRPAVLTGCRIEAPAVPWRIRLRALGLAVFPSIEGAEDMIAEAIRLRVPVLALRAAAERYGDRWRFATAGTPEEMADRIIEHGLAAAAPDGVSLTEAQDAAEREMDRDADAMGAYFLERLRVAISSRQPSR